MHESNVRVPGDGGALPELKTQEEQRAVVIVDNMRELILQKLNEIEARENVKIIYAAESGSRAWGFASTNADYDVRFIYIRQLEDYLRLNEIRDVIEWQLDETLDINGWDIKKTLMLMHKSNPTLFEWGNSPVVYRTTDEWERVMELFPGYFMVKPGLYHYLSMAKGNYREYLKRDSVLVKKYLYVIRPVLACRWIINKGTPPPVLFTELLEVVTDAALTDEIHKLLELKISYPEKKEVPRIEPLNRFIEEAIPALEEEISAMTGTRQSGWNELNKIFLALIRD